MRPLPYRVAARHQETADTMTLDLTARGEPIADPQPGQFCMLYAFGVGEIPISVSGRTPAGDIRHTIRAVGAVSAALCAARPGSALGLRGPLGQGWRLPAPAGTDVVVVAGGIGLAPLRPAIEHLLAHRGRYRRVTVLVGARTPADLLFARQYPDWQAAGAELRVTVDRTGAGWTGRVGLVTSLFDGVVVDPGRTVAYTCGPEVMMRFVARDLADQGVPPAAIDVSLERNMRCGAAWCGHCQLGPLIVCRDGPVVGYDRAGPLLAVKEL
jgi:NAD(P)H-flavin reductase